MAQRKLQAEIDRTFKKVSEGVEEFERIYEKMQDCTNPAQKEKLETDLKTQIKKLQRLRDQIKTWIQGNEVKDKTSLVDNRKLIEQQMEKFKACEKEMKTKAFSKAGLIAAQTLDPKEKEKSEAAEWITNAMTELNRQVEVTEAEIASIEATVKRKRGPQGGRAEQLKTLNLRRKFHVGRLEIVLRLVMNGSLPLESIPSLQDDVKYYVESNGEEDFEENTYMYDDFNLDQEEDNWRVIGGDAADHSDDEQSMVSDLPATVRPNGKDKTKTIDEPPVSPVQKKPAATTTRRVVEKAEAPKPAPVPAPNFAAQPMSQALKAGLPNGPAKPVNPPMRYAVAAGAAPPKPPTQPLEPTPPPATASSPSAASMSISASSPQASSIAPLSHITGGESVADDGISRSSRVHSPSTSPQVSVVSPLVQAMAASTISSNDKGPSETPVPKVEAAPPTNGVSKAAAPEPAAPAADYPSTTTAPIAPSQSPVVSSIAPPPGMPAKPQGPPPNLNSAPSPLPQQIQSQQAPSISSGSSVATIRPPVSAEDKAPQPQQPQRNLPGSLGDLVGSFEQVKQKAAQRMANPDQMHKLLEVAMTGTPQPTDADKPKYYVPRNPYNTPPYYPQQPLPILSSPALFAQLDVETLFYVFYFLPGTYQQYLAAQQLKNQSWRFHVKYLTWFQRHSEPQAITEEYEQGVYVYFDWEGSWCQRKKSDFRFEYRYLSED